MPARISDEQVEQFLGNLLRTGVMVAALIVVAGGTGCLLQQGRATPHWQRFRGEPEELRSIPAVVRASFHGEPRAVIQLGLLLLIATPIARVVFSVIAFAWERDVTYVIITLIVLAVLLYSFVGGAPL